MRTLTMNLRCRSPCVPFVVDRECTTNIQFRRAANATKRRINSVRLKRRCLSTTTLVPDRLTAADATGHLISRDVTPGVKR